MSEYDSYFVSNEVSTFLEEHKEKYRKLLGDVRIYINYLKNEICAEHIYRVYSRRDNKGETSEFKNFNKIVTKLIKWRQLYSKDSMPRDLHDIIGVSIIVYYESDINHVIDHIKESCEHYNLKIYPYKSGEVTRRYTRYGYHAEHLVVMSLNPELHGLKCEIQIKTLLHDAWHAKIHDLIYKPQGYLSAEHREIMESFGESIQAIEIQSQTIRKLVTQEWQDAEELRHVARTTMLDWLREKKFQDKNTNRKYKTIFNDIESNKHIIRNCYLRDKIIVELIERITELKDKSKGLNAAWRLMVGVASVRRDNQINHIAKDFLRDWLKSVSNPALGSFYASFAYYHMGERAGAIKELTEYLRKSDEMDPLHSVLKFNLFYYLIEEASCSWQGVSEIQAVCDRLKTDLEAEDWHNIPEDTRNGTIGYYHIVFGRSREEIRKGITMCRESDGSANLNSKYVQLHEEIGWRRYFNVRD
jgi:ppGpp synthetase/RelA/SpoT-type nucleotidyltranferase